MISLRKGSHADLRKYYTMMEIDFDRRELLGKLVLHKALSIGIVELYIIHEDESNIDLGYALLLTKNVYNYVLLKYYGIFPWYREKGVGTEAYSLLEELFRNKTGIVVEIPEFEDNDEEQIARLQKFFRLKGFEDIKTDYRISGAKTNLMAKGIKGTSHISKIAHRVIVDFYSRIVPVESIDIHKSDGE